MVSLAEMDPTFLLLSVPHSTGSINSFLKGQMVNISQLQAPYPSQRLNCAVGVGCIHRNSDGCDSILLTKPGVGWDSAHGCSLPMLLLYDERVWYPAARSKLFRNVPRVAP